MPLRQKDPKEFTVQISRRKFKTSIKNEDGQLRGKENIYSKKCKKAKKLMKKTFRLTFISCSASE